MDADELFRRSKKEHSCIDGLSPRVGNSLFRARFGINDKWEVDREKLLSAVLDGSIWQVKNIGIKSVKEICAWLSKQKNDLQKTP